MAHVGHRQRSSLSLPVEAPAIVSLSAQRQPRVQFPFVPNGQSFSPSLPPPLYCGAVLWGRWGPHEPFTYIWVWWTSHCQSSGLPLSFCSSICQQCCCCPIQTPPWGDLPLCPSAELFPGHGSPRSSSELQHGVSGAGVSAPLGLESVLKWPWEN